MHGARDVIVLIRGGRAQVDQQAVMGEVLDLDRMGMEHAGERFDGGV